MPPGIQSLFDYVGYPVGVLIIPPACGYSGIVDWTFIGCGLISLPSAKPPESTKGA